MYADAVIRIGDLELPGHDNLVLFRSSRDIQVRGGMGGEAASKQLGAPQITAEAYGLAECEAVTDKLKSSLRLMSDTVVSFVTKDRRLTIQADSVEYRLLGMYGNTLHYWLVVHAKRGFCASQSEIN